MAKQPTYLPTYLHIYLSIYLSTIYYLLTYLLHRPALPALAMPKKGLLLADAKWPVAFVVLCCCDCLSLA